MCLETGQVFPSMREAARFCGVSHSRVPQVIHANARPVLNFSVSHRPEVFHDMAKCGGFHLVHWGTEQERLKFIYWKETFSSEEIGRYREAMSIMTRHYSSSRSAS
jgi:hypothetical protein